MTFLSGQVTLFTLRFSILGIFKGMFTETTEDHHDLSKIESRTVCRVGKKVSFLWLILLKQNSYNRLVNIIDDKLEITQVCMRIPAS